MIFPTIRIEGAILSADILDTIAQGEGLGQTAENFGLPKTAKVKDEIARAWADALDYWRIFKRKLEQTDGFGTTETRKFWVVPLLNLLGYDPTLQTKGEEVQGRNYVISHRDQGGFPIHVVGWRDKLDEKRQTANGPRLSPHGLVQEYINLTEHVYALVTNGSSLRLLRDGSRLVRLSFVEFDLERMMDEEVFADFAVLYRLLHASRMPSAPDQTPESWIERYHQDALESGSRIRDGLSHYVKEAIERFANGFLQHPSNAALREQFATGQLSAEKYYELLLRLIYRLLFLMVTEERNIIYDAEAIKDDSTLKRLKDIYDQYYSLARLRRLAERRHLSDAKHTDLWTGLLDTFRLFEDGTFGKSLGITPLGGRLFGLDAMGPLRDCTLDNGTLLDCLLKLSLFNHPKTGQRIRVNYAALNVEEFGSVYEGLLELDASVMPQGSTFVFAFVKGEGRGRSGSHYTPEELVQPLIKHSLDYLIADKLKQPDREQALLSLKVLDPACGSGHILLSAARRLATELARVRTNEDQPNPAAFRQALRDVVRNCIYGVDKNPAAVELCKVALWLESHTPGEPLGFLDHRIRCGDAIVGLTHATDLKEGIADEAFKALPRDDKGIASQLLKRNREARQHRNQLGVSFGVDLTDAVAEVQADYQTLAQMPDQTPEDVAAKATAFDKLLHRTGRERVRALADAVVAPFFISKTADNVTRILTDDAYREILRGYAGWQTPATAFAKAVSADKRFFHWFLEFPDVFITNDAGGFDCIIGNPPFLGGLKISTNYGADYLNHIHRVYSPTGGTADFVAYFFRRAFWLIKDKGFLSLISTNTIGQGDTRSGSLELLVNDGGTINHAVRSMKWPGQAAVEVALVTVAKQKWLGPLILNGKPAEQITAYLDESEAIGNPYVLVANADKSFVGSYVLGKGFILEPNEARRITDSDPKYHDVIFPYLNGEDLNNNPDQSPSRYVINFFDWPLRRYTVSEWNTLTDGMRETVSDRVFNKSFVITAPPTYPHQVAEDYPICLEIVERLVKPERQRWKEVNGKEIVGEYALRPPLPERWWIYGEKRPALYAAISSRSRILVHTRVTKTHSFAWYNTDIVYSEATVIFEFQNSTAFALLQSSLHESWAWNYSSSMKGDRRYSPSDCFQTFPLSVNFTTDLEAEFKQIGEQYHEHRRQLMLEMQLGLTKTYNLFHSQPLRSATAEELVLDDKPFEKLLGKEATHLRKHLARTPEATLSFNEAVAGIEQLRVLHVQMDTVVRNAYGWQDLALSHAFHEVDYLPENDRIRYTISPAARKEVLKRLLLLNHKLYAEEQAEKAAQNVAKPKSRATKPKSTTRTNGIAGNSSPAAAVVAEPESTYQTAQNRSSREEQDLRTLTTPLFAAAAQMVVRERSRVTLQSTDGQTTLRLVPVRGAQKGQFDGNYQIIDLSGELAQVILGRREGQQVEFKGKAYKITNVD